MTAIALGVPVSTTQAITGAIVGVGALRSRGAVNWSVVQQILWAWVLTIPASATLAGVAYWFGRLGFDVDRNIAKPKNLNRTVRGLSRDVYFGKAVVSAVRKEGMLDGPGGTDGCWASLEGQTHWRCFLCWRNCGRLWVCRWGLLASTTDSEKRQPRKLRGLADRLRHWVCRSFPLPLMCHQGQGLCRGRHETFDWAPLNLCLTAGSAGSPSLTPPDQVETVLLRSYVGQGPRVGWHPLCEGSVRTPYARCHPGPS